MSRRRRRRDDDVHSLQRTQRRESSLAGAAGRAQFAGTLRPLAVRAGESDGAAHAGNRVDDECETTRHS
jgi:hypothetical protein